MAEYAVLLLAHTGQIWYYDMLNPISKFSISTYTKAHLHSVLRNSDQLSNFTARRAQARKRGFMYKQSLGGWGGGVGFLPDL